MKGKEINMYQMNLYHLELDKVLGKRSCYLLEWQSFQEKEYSISLTHHF